MSEKTTTVIEDIAERLKQIFQKFREDENFDGATKDEIMNDACLYGVKIGMEFAGVSEENATRMMLEINDKLKIK